MKHLHLVLLLIVLSFGFNSFAQEATVESTPEFATYSAEVRALANDTLWEGEDEPYIGDIWLINHESGEEQLIFEGQISYGDQVFAEEYAWHSPFIYENKLYAIREFGTLEVPELWQYDLETEEAIALYVDNFWSEGPKLALNGVIYVRESRLVIYVAEEGNKMGFARVWVNSLTGISELSENLVNAELIDVHGFTSEMQNPITELVDDDDYEIIFLD